MYIMLVSIILIALANSNFVYSAAAKPSVSSTTTAFDSSGSPIEDRGCTRCTHSIEVQCRTADGTLHVLCQKTVHRRSARIVMHSDPVIYGIKDGARVPATTDKEVLKYLQEKANNLKLF